MAMTRVQRIYLNGTEMFAQAMWFLLHSLFSLLAWGVLMVGITLIQPGSMPAMWTLALSTAFPMLAGFVLVKIRDSDVATLTWLAGLVWFMIVGLWILDMPTGPGACYQCYPGDKLWYTFFSFHWDSGMIDGQGRLVGTWPTAAMIGYSIGATFAKRSRQASLQQPA